MSFRLSAFALLVFVSPHIGLAAPAYPKPDLSWEAQAKRACKSGEFEMFLEAFIRSENVQKQYTANIVKVTRSGKTRRIKRRDYGPVPIEMMDYHFIVRGSADVASGSVPLKVETQPYGKGGYRLDWIRATYNDLGEGDSLGEIISTEGPPGYLIFKKNYNCWELANDLVAEVDGK